MHTIIENIGLQFGPGTAWLFTSLLIFLRYALPASLAFMLIYKWKRKEWFAWKIQQKFPKPAQIRHEIMYSLFTSLLFGGMALGVFLLRKVGYGQLYFEVSEHGWAYLIFSLIFLMLAHDTYFYWIHRLMHHPKLFHRFHLVHHKSTNPTPYTSFSFHPLESVLEFAIIPVLTLLLPIHAVVFFLFTLLSIAFNIFGHTGYEISPSGFTRHRLFKWFNTPTHHNMHHHQSRYNYSLYFNIWDRLMGTNHPDYDRYFEEVVQRSGKQRQAKSAIPESRKIPKAAAVITLMLCSSVAFGQMSTDAIKLGNYGTPESRTLQVDSIMQLGLGLRQLQIFKTHEINLRYAHRVEDEVVQQQLGDWSKYRRIMRIQADKDKELKVVLDGDQFEKYSTARDALFWKGVKDYFF